MENKIIGGAELALFKCADIVSILHETFFKNGCSGCDLNTRVVIVFFKDGKVELRKSVCTTMLNHYKHLENLTDEQRKKKAAELESNLIEYVKNMSLFENHKIRFY